MVKYTYRTQMVTFACAPPLCNNTRFQYSLIFIREAIAIAFKEIFLIHLEL